MGPGSTEDSALPVLRPGRQRSISGTSRVRQSRAAALVLALAALALPAIALGAEPAAAARGASIIRSWDSFYSVAFVPSGKCYVIGAEGALLASSDGGQSWQRREIARRGDLSWSDLYSIRFAADGRNGWISGEGGLILRTTDGGENWNPQTSGTTENLFRIAVVDAQTAFAAGSNGVLMGTTDGGAHWQVQMLKSGLTMFDIAFADAQDGWAVGEFETIIHTSDGGKTWAPQMGGKRANFRSPALFAVRFADAQHGWVTGQGGTVLRTDDGGKSWQTFAAPSEAPMYGVTYVGGAPGATPTQLWGAGDGGTLMRVMLEGALAPTVQQPTVFSLSDIAIHGQDGVAVGLSGTILRTADGGAHWQLVSGK
jgi:photosystem II stability/assembly factor-like uncharacterized protein